MTSKMVFMGDFDPTYNYSIGDVVVDKDAINIYTDSGWKEMGNLNDEPGYEAVIEEDITCKRCGNSLFLNGWCAYCGANKDGFVAVIDDFIMSPSYEEWENNYLTSEEISAIMNIESEGENV